MSHVIIGIHGRAPKPRKPTLTKWWHQSLIEGLVRNERRSPNTPGPNFELAYYANVFEPPIPDNKNSEPYHPAEGQGPLPTYEDSWFDRIRSSSFDTLGDAADSVREFFGFERFTDEILKNTMKDLFQYFDDQATRQKVRTRLLATLKKPLQQQQRIMVIAHSMGAIVAYDVLRKLGRDEPGSVIHHFITIGSPLGLPYVKFKIQQENDLVRTPSCVERWTNFADRRDWVAFDTHLADDYEPNDAGVKVNDDLVINTYLSPQGEPNEHKSYGYLRAPELSATVRAFI